MRLPYLAFMGDFSLLRTPVLGVCLNFVGPGRFVGQLLAVVLQLWDTPRSGGRLTGERIVVK